MSIKKIYQHQRGRVPLHLRLRAVSKRSARKSEKERGDTIIEVMLAMTVMSLVLVASYALANRDSRYVQQSLEHAQAQNISEQQLELLRNYLTPDTDWNGSHFVCFNNASPPQPTANAAQCAKGTAGRYRVQISYSSATSTYHINTHWSSLNQTADQNMDFYYKLPLVALAPVGIGPDFPTGGGGVIEPDTDGDGIPDSVDECADVFAATPNGCPPDRTLTIAKSVSGGGTVSGDGINCGSTCTKTVPDGTSINISSLSVTASANYVFTGWSPSQCNGTVTLTANLTCTANFTHVPRVPLYRCYNASVTDHYYTVQSWMCYNGISGPYPWIYYEGVVGYVPTGGSYSYLPVYGGYNASIGDSFYTTSYDEYYNAHVYGGWNQSSGYQGWNLYPNCSVPGTVPLYRKNHSGVGDHLYTTNYGEAPHYQYEGVQGCLFSRP